MTYLHGTLPLADQPLFQTTYGDSEAQNTIGDGAFPSPDMVQVTLPVASHPIPTTTLEKRHDHLQG